ncbi:high mobility group nucleosome-binding domain-containing protein 5-like [Anabas testudineus]|uniref:high mobility group nucleosome-binding domain-containing protein 5-like n=1 Tax=Anabas testudineus TaxID=64144 RepID=UPI000E463FD8|nr:high mobility group nucleosome-binding domain-containing protein 5-like [Anabas testudineus]
MQFFFLYNVNKPVLLQSDLSSFQSHTHFRVTQLQQRWQELKERELRAQQHNKELLQQFEKAQDTLKEMLAQNAAMKTIRIEYERYLEENSSRWQQQLKEKTQHAQRTRMEDCLRSCLKNMEEQETKSSANRHSRSQGPTKKPATQEYHNQNIHSSYPPFIQSSWLTQPQSQTVRFPMRPCQPENFSYVPPSFLPHLHPFTLHHFTSTPSHSHPWPRQDPPGWSSLQTDIQTAGADGLPSGSEALWGQLYTEEPPPESRLSQVLAQDVEASRAASSKSERGGGSRSSRLSQELDIKPVRLSSGHAESSESGRDSSQMIREKRKERRRRSSQCTSSEKAGHSSQEASRASSAIIIASVAAVQSSESDASSGKCISSGRKKRKWRSEGRVADSPQTDKVAKERTRSKEDDSGSHKDVSQCAGEESGTQSEESASENAGNQSADEKSETFKNEKRKIENGAGDEKDKQESSSSTQNSADEKDDEDGDNNAEEKESRQKEDEQEEEVEESDDSQEKDNSLKEEEQKENEDVFARKKTSKDEEETGVEEEMEEQESEGAVKDENCENRSSTSSQEEDVEDESEHEEDKTEGDEDGTAEEDDGEGQEEEEQRSEKAGEPEEESNSEDSIIAPHESRTHIPDEAAEDDDNEKGSKRESSNKDDSSDFSEDDDIENLLAPQEQTEMKEEKDLKGAETPAVCDKMKIFQVEDESDEFDHFYD